MTRANEEGPFRVNVDEFPLLRITYPHAQQFSTPSNQSFFSCLDRGLAFNAPFVILHDAQGLPQVNDIQRREFLELLDLRRTRIERQVVACASLCSSPIERGLITAFIWFMRLSVPVRMFEHEAEARAWLMKHYEKSTRGTATPSQLAPHHNAPNG